MPSIIVLLMTAAVAVPATTDDSVPDEASAIALAKRQCSILTHGMELEGPWRATRDGDAWIVTLHDTATFDVQPSETLAPTLAAGRHCVTTSIKAEVGVRDGQVRKCDIRDDMACP